MLIERLMSNSGTDCSSKWCSGFLGTTHRHDHSNLPSLFVDWNKCARQTERERERERERELAFSSMLRPTSHKKNDDDDRMAMLQGDPHHARHIGAGGDSREGLVGPWHQGTHSTMEAVVVRSLRSCIILLSRCVSANVKIRPALLVLIALDRCMEHSHLGLGASADLVLVEFEHGNDMARLFGQESRSFSVSQLSRPHHQFWSLPHTADCCIVDSDRVCTHLVVGSRLCESLDRLVQAPCAAPERS